MIGSTFRGDRRQQLQQTHHGFARCFVVPFFVAHDDFQKLIHGTCPIVAGQKHACFGKARVEVSLVGGNERIKLFQRPLTHRVGGHKGQSIEPLLQSFEAQFKGDLRQAGLEHGAGVFKLAHADQQFDQVKAHIVVFGVGLERFEQFGLCGF